MKSFCKKLLKQLLKVQYNYVPRQTTTFQQRTSNIEKFVNSTSRLTQIEKLALQDCYIYIIKFYSIYIPLMETKNVKRLENIFHLMHLKLVGKQ